MATLEWLTPPEQKDVSKSLYEMYERCEHNMKMLCKKFEAMENKDFDPLQLSIQDIAEIQKIFPQWKSWKLDHISLEEKYAHLPLNNYKPENEPSMLEVATWKLSNLTWIDSISDINTGDIKISPTIKWGSVSPKIKTVF